MSSSRAISGGIGNSGISVEELVYLMHQCQTCGTSGTLSPGLVCEIHAHFLEDMAWDFAEVHLKCKSYSHDWKRFYFTSLVSFSANWPGPESIAWNTKYWVSIHIPLQSARPYLQEPPCVLCIQCYHLDSARGKSMVPGHHKLMPITADQLHIPELSDDYLIWHW